MFFLNLFISVTECLFFNEIKCLFNEMRPLELYTNARAITSIAAFVIDFH